jgi:hypothetical protein
VTGAEETKTRMTYLYCWKWNERRRSPVDELTEEQARRAWEDGPQLGVAAGERLEPGKVPAYTLTMSPHGEDVSVHRYTAEGSIESITGYETFEGRLFLSDVTEYLYPDDGQFHGMSASTASRTYTFRPDGYSRLRTSVEEADADTVEEFTDVDVSDHWLDPLEWGDWERIGHHRPTSVGPEA